MEDTAAVDSDQWTGNMCSNCLLRIHSTMSFQFSTSDSIWQRLIIIDKDTIPNNLYRIIVQSEDVIIIGEISLSDCRFICGTLAEFDGDV
mmetsp:Transcript_10627/g.17595  ORF Transcript_10627/g.17595 Transcript_10627/m.17595 type:complete len:90 (-) Transcript_10627:134-403(-)